MTPHKQMNFKVADKKLAQGIIIVKGMVSEATEMVEVVLWMKVVVLVEPGLGVEVDLIHQEAAALIKVLIVVQSVSLCG